MLYMWLVYLMKVSHQALYYNTMIANFVIRMDCDFVTRSGIVQRYGLGCRTIDHRID